MQNETPEEVTDRAFGRILDEVDRGFEEQLTFTKELIQYPSLRGQEHTAQEFIYWALSERGYAMDRWTIDIGQIESHPGFSPVNVSYENAVNVVATHTPNNAVGRSLILNGHIDVVPTGPADMWSTPPFEPKVDGDWLYGRGAGDMKAGLVANIFAMDAIRRAGFEPAATVYLQSVTEEECTGNGTLSALVRGYRADAAVIPEPEDDKLVRANVGVIWCKIHVRGMPVHVREASSGSNAIAAGLAIAGALQDLENKWNAQKADHPYFADVERPININIGKIKGGDWASSVPAWCTLHVRVAIYPGIDPKDAATELEEHIQEFSRNDPFLSNNPPAITYNGFFARGYTLEEGSDAEETLARAFERVYAGQKLESFVTPGYLDGRVFVIYDSTPCLVYGPHSERIHGFDERVSLSSVRRVTKTIGLYIAEWCGLKELHE